MDVPLESFKDYLARINRSVSILVLMDVPLESIMP